MGVLAAPHQAFWAGRDSAWQLDAMNAAYSLAPSTDGSWRQLKRPWYELWLETAALGQIDCSRAYPGGFMTRKSGNDKVLPGTGETYFRIQTWEELLVRMGLKGAGGDGLCRPR
jgi:hypothetical protein